VPAVIKQAHERIIGGRQIPSDEKILILNSFQVETNNPRPFRDAAQSIGIGG